MSLKEALGCNLTRAHKHMKSVLKGHRLGVPFRDETIKTLLSHHPSKKFGTHDTFIMAKRPPYNRPCLFSVSRAQRMVDVSWVKCLKKLYGHSTDTSRTNVLMAFRNEAFKSDGMQRARKAIGVGRCKECDKVCKLVIDHSDKPFAQIVDEFLEDRGVALTDVKVKYCRSLNLFKDQKLAALWHAWHDKHAVLEGLCRRCNCSKGSSGYRHVA
jgi:hypothetical protein